MKSRTTVFVFLAVLASYAWAPLSASAQTISVRGVKTDVSTTPGDFMEAYAEVKNLTANSLRVKLVRSKNRLPDGWASSICFGQECYAPAVNEAVVDLDASSTTVLKVTFETSTVSGEGEVEIHVANANNLSEDYTVTFMGRAPGTVSVDRVSASRSITLAQNYPNPFSLTNAPVTSIAYTNAKPGPVIMKIYNLLGSEVRTLVNEYKPGGSFIATWDARDNRGELLPPGIYVYKIMSGSNSLTRRMILSR